MDQQHHRRIHRTQILVGHQLVLVPDHTARGHRPMMPHRHRPADQVPEPTIRPPRCPESAVRPLRAQGEIASGTARNCSGVACSTFSRGSGTGRKGPVRNGSSGASRGSDRAASTAARRRRRPAPPAGRPRAAGSAPPPRPPRRTRPGLVGPAPGEALLGPAAGLGGALDVARADLGRDQLGCRRTPRRHARPGAPAARRSGAGVQVQLQRGQRPGRGRLPGPERHLDPDPGTVRGADQHLLGATRPCNWVEAAVPVGEAVQPFRQPGGRHRHPAGVVRDRVDVGGRLRR